MSTQELQQAIVKNMSERGYLTSNNVEEQRQQLIKATEELGEVARYIFDGKAPPSFEIADVIIPLICLAYVSGIKDILRVALLKSRSDIKRGVR